MSRSRRSAAPEPTVRGRGRDRHGRGIRSSATGPFLPPLRTRLDLFDMTLVAAIEYLRGLCQDDGLARGTYKVFGHNVSLKDIQIPVCAIACETDHIAHWRGSFNGFKQMGSTDKTFIVSQSGHVAGIINPPSKGKYGHYTNPGPVAGAPDDWMASATFNQGSWWPRWGAWLAAQSGPQIAARIPGDSVYPVLCAAPGTYVLRQTASPKG